MFKNASPLNALSRFFKLNFSPKTYIDVAKTSLKNPGKAIKAQYGFHGEDVSDFYRKMVSEAKNPELARWADEMLKTTDQSRAKTVSAKNALKENLSKYKQTGDLKGLMKESLKPAGTLAKEVGLPAIGAGFGGLSSYAIMDSILKDYQRGDIGPARALGNAGAEAFSSVVGGPFLVNAANFIGSGIAGDMVGEKVDEITGNSPRQKITPQMYLEMVRRAKAEQEA